MNTSSPDTQRTRHELARWTEGDDSSGAGTARAQCGHCNLTILRPPTPPFALIRSEIGFGGIFLPAAENHLGERLFDQKQAQAPYAPFLRIVTAVCGFRPRS